MQRVLAGQHRTGLIIIDDQAVTFKCDFHRFFRHKIDTAPFGDTDAIGTSSVIDLTINQALAIQQYTRSLWTSGWILSVRMRVPVTALYVAANTTAPPSSTTLTRTDQPQRIVQFKISTDGKLS